MERQDHSTAPRRDADAPTVRGERWGHGQFTAYQLKIIQEIITLVVFTGFAAAWLGETPRWNTVVALLLILAATVFAFLPHHT